MTFTNGTAVNVLTGKFAGEVAEVVTLRTDRNGVERVQVRFENGTIFSYLPTSLSLFVSVADVRSAAAATA